MLGTYFKRKHRSKYTNSFKDHHPYEENELFLPSIHLMRIPFASEITERLLEKYLRDSNSFTANSFSEGVLSGWIF